MKFKILTSLVCFFSLSLFAQETSISFLSDKDVAVRIYRPVDNVYNFFYCNDTIPLQANVEYVYQLPIDEWSNVSCVFSDNAKIELFVEANKPLQILKNGSRFSYVGENGNSNAYYNDLSFQMRLSLYPKISPIFDNNTTDDSINIKKIIHELDAEVWSQLYAMIDSVRLKDDLDEKGFQFIQTNQTYQVSFRIFQRYLDLLSEYDERGRNEVVVMIDSLFARCSPLEKSIFKYSSGNNYAGRALGYLFDQLSEDEKNALVGLYESDVLGPYKRYLLASPNDFLSILFSAFVAQYLYGVNEFNREKMFHYVSEHYPKSESVEIMRKLINEELNDTTELIVSYIEPQIVNQLSELSKVTEFKNKYIFVDLWASWCLPCRQEFLHTKALNSLLSQYKDLEILYISIDSDVESWRKSVESLKLSNYHLNASEKLVDSIKEEIYDSQAISIPRYLLLAPDGIVVHTNLPRPSDSANLQKCLDEILK